MKLLRFLLFCHFVASFTMTACVAKGDNIPVGELVEALGKAKKVKNNQGVVAYDFSRGKRNLRLEDIMLNSAPLKEGCSVHGAFTLAHVKKAGASKTESSGETADRILVSYTATNGKLELSLKRDEGEEPLKIVLTAAAVVIDPEPEDAKIATNFMTKLKKYCTGDAGAAMENVLDVLSKRLITLSQTKLPKIEKSHHIGWT